MLVEIIPKFHYCLISCFANCSGTLKIDKVIIIGNFQKSICNATCELATFWKTMLFELDDSRRRNRNWNVASTSAQQRRFSNPKQNESEHSKQKY